MRIRDWSSDVCSSDLYPDIEVRIATSIRPADLEREGIDCAIRHGDGHWPGVSATRLFSESLVPVAHPKFARGKEALRKPADLKGHKLLHSQNRREDWRIWLSAAGIKDKARSEEHTSELQSLMRISYAVFCLKKKK